MDTLTEIIKNITKQQQKTNPIFGLSSFQNMTELIRQSQKPMNLAGLVGITDIANSLAKQINPIQKTNSFVTGNLGLQASLVSTQKTSVNNNFALSGLSSSLVNIFKHNQTLSDKVAGIALSQLSLSNNLSQLAKSIENTHLNKFNSLNIAIQGISSLYLNDFIKHKQWDNIEIIEEVNETISSITETFISKSEYVTKEDLQEIKISIVSEFTELFKKSKTENVRRFLFELIAIIGLILNIYSTHNSLTEITNQEVLNATKIEIDNIKKELFQTIEYEFEKKYKTRISKTNVNLRYSNNKRSKILGLVKKGQQVTVIEIRHKWLLVSFIDNDTNEPKSGFVFKKYFKYK